VPRAVFRLPAEKGRTDLSVFDDPKNSKSGNQSEQAAVETSDSPPPPYWSQTPLSEALARHRVRLLAIKGVYGVSEGQDPNGQEIVRVDVESTDAASGLPPDVDGFPVRVVVVPGGFHAQRA
jgi:hypothetical protein